MSKSCSFKMILNWENYRNFSNKWKYVFPSYLALKGFFNTVFTYGSNQIIIFILVKMAPEHAYTRCFPVRDLSENAFIFKKTDVIETFSWRHLNIKTSKGWKHFTYLFSIWLELSVMLWLKISYEIEFFGQEMHDTAGSPFQINSFSSF